MVKRAFWLAASLFPPLLLLSTASRADALPATPTLQIFTNNAPVSADQTLRGEFGKPLFLELVYRGSRRDARDYFVLDDWRESAFWLPGDAQVSAGEAANPGTAPSFERRLALRLYPRQPGRYSLPALAHGGAVLRPLQLDIHEAHRTDHRGAWQVGGARIVEAPDVLWQGETAIIQVEIDRLHPANEFEPLEFDWRDFHVRRLAQLEIEPEIEPESGAQRAAENANHGQARRRLAWALIAKQAGEQTFELPGIARRGHGVWRFHLPLIALHVRPLPAYLPPGTPVTDLQISSKTLRLDGRPFWQIDVLADGWLRNGLPDLEGQLLGIAAASDARLDKQTKHQIGHDRINTQLRYRIPVPRGALFQRPALQVSHFSLKQQRWQQQNLRLSTASNPTNKQNAIGLVLLALALWLVWKRAGQQLGELAWQLTSRAVFWSSALSLWLFDKTGIRHAGVNDWLYLRLRIRPQATKPEWLTRIVDRLAAKRYGSETR